MEFPLHSQISCNKPGLQQALSYNEHNLMYELGAACFPYIICVRTNNSCTANWICDSYSILLGQYELLPFKPTHQEILATVNIMQAYSSRDQSDVEELEKMLFSSRHRLQHRLTNLSKSNCGLNGSCHIFSSPLTVMFYLFS